MNKLTVLAFILLCASVSPVFAVNQVRTGGKSDGQIILDLKDQVDNEWKTDLKIGAKWFGIGAVTGSVITAVLMAKGFKISRR